MCHLLMDDVVSMDNYTLDLWAGQQLLWKGSFKPSEHGEQGRVWRAWVGVFPQPPGLRVWWAGEVGGVTAIAGGSHLYFPKSDRIPAPAWASVLPFFKQSWAQ